MSAITDAATILRQHGINAYAQDDNLAIYAVQSGAWTEVTRVSVAHQIADVVAGPHTHDAPAPRYTVCPRCGESVTEGHSHAR